jgi:hypothetical protein
MSIPLDYFINEIREEQVGSFADLLMTPFRVLFNGRSYYLFRKADDEYILDNILKEQPSQSRVFTIVKKVVCAAQLLLFFPLVLTGIALKARRWYMDEKVKDNYEMVRVRQKEKMLLINKLYLAPIPFEIDHLVQQDVNIQTREEKKLELLELAALWEKYGDRKDGNFEEVKSALEKFASTVLNLSDYNIIPAGYVEEAARQLQGYLKVIVQELKKEGVDQEQKASILIEICNASQACSPTWLQVAAQKCKELKGVGSSDQKILQLVQSFKELKLAIEGQKHTGKEWHILNNIRKVFGTEWGLDTKVAQYDSMAWGLDLSKHLIRGQFYRSYKLDELVDFIQDRINSQPYADNQDLPLLMINSLVRKGMDRDEASEFTLSRFYYDEGKKVTKEGVLELLEAVEIIG